MIAVNMEWSSQHGWTFVTPRKMTAQALARACEKVLSFYQRMREDFMTSGNHADVEIIAACLCDLERNRVRNVVDPGMIPKELRPYEGPLEISLPGQR